MKSFSLLVSAFSKSGSLNCGSAVTAANHNTCDNHSLITICIHCDSCAGQATMLEKCILSVSRNRTGKPLTLPRNSANLQQNQWMASKSLITNVTRYVVQGSVGSGQYTEFNVCGLLQTWVMRVGYIKDIHSFVTTSDDGEIKVWDWKMTKLVSLYEHQHAVVSFDWSEVTLCTLPAMI